MRDLHIVLPMAGRGSRFANLGYKIPKPLIKVDDMPMFLKALSSLDKIKAKKYYTIILREEHNSEYDLISNIKTLLPTANIVVSTEEPKGALNDAYRAIKFIKPDQGIILLDCDLWFNSQSYIDMVEGSLLDSNINGGILTFESSNPRYSYALIDKNNYVLRTAEKDPISTHAITGAYYIASKDTFSHNAKAVLSRPLSDKMPEYYISYIYNEILKHGGKIKAAKVDEFYSFGTPEELNDYNVKKSRK